MRLEYVAVLVPRPFLENMQKLCRKNWLLLGYLVLLFNLGPSVHHADFFGLHCDDAACCASTSEATPFSSCCCCHAGHSHGGDSTHSHEGSRHDDEAGLSSASDGCGTPCDGCAFCNFFDQFNVVAVSFRFVIAESPIYSLIANTQGIACCESVPKSARGPPEFLAAELAV